MEEKGIGQANIQIEDLNVDYVAENDTKYKRYLERAKKSKGLKAVKATLAENGITLDSDSAIVRKVRVSKLKDMHDEVPEILQIVYPNKKKGEDNGETFFTEGTEGELVYSVVNTGKDSYEINYYEQGQVESMKMENNKVVESTKDLSPRNQIAVSCEGVCGVICAGGFGTQIGGCIWQCKLLGPGAIYCSGLCAIIVGLGCLIGCDSLCKFF